MFQMQGSAVYRRDKMEAWDSKINAAFRAVKRTVSNQAMTKDCQRQREKEGRDRDRELGPATPKLTLGQYN